MIIDPNNVQIALDVNFWATEYDEILQNVRVILSTPVGSVPFDREFGVDFDIVDLPMERAKNKITVEFIKKIKRYEPRVKVKKITFEYNGNSGILWPKVVLKLV